MIVSAFWSFIGQTSDPLSETSETDSASEIEPNTETLPLANSKAAETILPKRVKVKKALPREVLIAPLLDVKEPPNVKKFNWVMEDGKMIKKQAASSPREALHQHVFPLCHSHTMMEKILCWSTN